ncbi:hypothetical protein ACFX13_014148 [Malus domestica]
MLLLSTRGAAQVVLWSTTRLNSSRRSSIFLSFSHLQLKTTTFLKKALIVKLSCSRIRVLMKAANLKIVPGHPFKTTWSSPWSAARDLIMFTRILVEEVVLMWEKIALTKNFMGRFLRRFPS